jgi:two-component system, OmpR family, sensor kinase
VATSPQPRATERLAARLRSTPLRIKLLAAVLALVFAALSLISVASTLALRGYLLGRVDNELKSVAGFLAESLEGVSVRQLMQGQVTVPTEYMFALRNPGGVGETYYNKRALQPTDLPQLITGLDAIEDRVQDQPYTVTAPSRRMHWRMVIVPMGNGDYLFVGRNMSEIEFAVTRLIWIDLLVGLAVLITMAAVGAGIVRTSLVPLVEIEQTAGAIAAGDLTRRVPDPEPDAVEPRTELGRLSRALNAMLAQIEAAFTARAWSETAARAAESAARDAAEAAQLSEARAVRSEEKMRQFVADASHELRTPLTTIRGFAELYRQGAVTDPGDVAALIRRIEDEAARMGLLVEDLLLLARLDRERPLNLAPVELPVLAMDAVQAARATAPDRKIELEIRDGPEKLVAYGDDARLRQVVGNLMTNALVHTPPDAAVTLRLYAQAGNRAVIEVADTGPGLSGEQRDRVFERFYRTDGARTRHTDRSAAGTGLGLAIVAAIVRAHSGTVSVDSQSGEGATFRVTLPAVEPDISGPG